MEISVRQKEEKRKAQYLSDHFLNQIRYLGYEP